MLCLLCQDCRRAEEQWKPVERLSVGQSTQRDAQAMQNSAQGQFNIRVDAPTVFPSFIKTRTLVWRLRAANSPLRSLKLEITVVVPWAILKCWNMQDSTTEHIYWGLILIMCDFVLSETGASQSLCWRGPSGWEPAPSMSAVLQHSHPAHPPHRRPCLPQVSFTATDRLCLSLLW